MMVLPLLSSGCGWLLDKGKAAFAASNAILSYVLMAVEALEKSYICLCENAAGFSDVEAIV